MKKMLQDEQNLWVMSQPKHIAAEKQLEKAKAHIVNDIALDGSAEYYLKVLPSLLKRLEDAYVNLIEVEAVLEAEYKNAPAEREL